MFHNSSTRNLAQCVYVCCNIYFGWMYSTYFHIHSFMFMLLESKSVVSDWLLVKENIVGRRRKSIKNTILNYRGQFNLRFCFRFLNFYFSFLIKKNDGIPNYIQRQISQWWQKLKYEIYSVYISFLLCNFFLMQGIMHLTIIRNE